eukprot:m.85801 g.85801  ORF g.85801 m.85801 type:complete len:956 (-) comp25901_c0_seq2:78-2945(-)
MTIVTVLRGLRRHASTLLLQLLDLQLWQLIRNTMLTKTMLVVLMCTFAFVGGMSATQQHQPQPQQQMQAHQQRQPIIISTDPGVDDSIAILLALASPEVELRAVCVNFGSLNDTDQLSSNALRVLALAKANNVPVYLGAGLPLAAPFHDLGGENFHGHDGTGGVPPPATATHGINTTLTAAAFIVEACQTWDPKPTLISISPLTNIALALDLDRNLPQMCTDLFIMGGTVTTAGNVSPLAEANLANDAEAAQRVFNAGFNLRVAGLDVTMATWLDGAYLDSLRTLPGPIGTWVADMTVFYRNAYQHIGFNGSMPLHDPSAVLMLIQPSLYGLQRWPATIDTSPFPSVTRGLVVADRRAGPLSPPWTPANATTQFAMTVNATGVRILLRQRLALLSQRVSVKTSSSRVRRNSVSAPTSVAAAVAAAAGETVAQKPQAVAGYHVDDETCSGLLSNNKTEQIILCAKFLASLTNMRMQLNQIDSRLKLSVDAGTSWTCPGGATGCFNITYANKTQSVGAHVVDLADEVVIMDYDRNATQVYTRALPYLMHADEVNRNSGGTTTKKTIVVGLAVAAYNSSTPTWWQTASEVELETLMDAVKPMLARHTSWKSFAVFTTQYWRSQQPHSNRTAGTFHNTSAYYINHTMVLHDLPARSAWLQWARSRAITDVYIAPHANDALISIPGVEGSAADDKTFCDFLGEASSRGVATWLISNPETDLHFLNNCTTTELPNEETSLDGLNLDVPQQKQISNPHTEPWSSCEMRDGDCEPCSSSSHVSPTATILLSQEKSLVTSAKSAQQVIKQHANKTDFIRFDDADTGLHTSMFYFCCHTPQELEKMHAAFSRMRWNAIEIEYHSSGCNVDTHDNKTVYIHALPTNKSQSDLFAWARVVESTMANAGVVINHPRKSLFHMTLARVTRNFPTDVTVKAIDNKVPMFGYFNMTSFLFDGVWYSPRAAL